VLALVFVGLLSQSTTRANVFVRKHAKKLIARCGDGSMLVIRGASGTYLLLAMQEISFFWQRPLNLLGMRERAGTGSCAIAEVLVFRWSLRRQKPGFLPSARCYAHRQLANDRILVALRVETSAALIEDVVPQLPQVAVSAQQSDCVLRETSEAARVKDAQQLRFASWRQRPRWLIVGGGPAMVKNSHLTLYRHTLLRSFIRFA